jgi:hypothetical protein
MKMMEYDSRTKHLMFSCMQKVLTALMVVFMANSIGAQAQETTGKPQKILVACFSWGGNTREIAKQIQQ